MFKKIFSSLKTVPTSCHNASGYNLLLILSLIHHATLKVLNIKIFLKYFKSCLHSAAHARGDRAFFAKKSPLVFGRYQLLLTKGNSGSLKVLISAEDLEKFLCERCRLMPVSVPISRASSIVEPTGSRSVHLQSTVHSTLTLTYFTYLILTYFTLPF